MDSLDVSCLFWDFFFESFPVILDANRTFYVGMTMQKLHCFDLDDSIIYRHIDQPAHLMLPPGSSQHRDDNRKANLNMMRYRDLYEKTIKKWGEEAQYDQMIEECAELIATLQHYARGKVHRDAVVHELADVFLMVGQLAYMFGEDQLSEAVSMKVAKLQGLLEEST